MKNKIVVIVCSIVLSVSWLVSGCSGNTNKPILASASSTISSSAVSGQSSSGASESSGVGSSVPSKSLASSSASMEKIRVEPDNVYAIDFIGKTGNELIQKYGDYSFGHGNDAFPTSLVFKSLPYKFYVFKDRLSDPITAIYTDTKGAFIARGARVGESVSEIVKTFGKKADVYTENGTGESDGNGIDLNIIKNMNINLFVDSSGKYVTAANVVYYDEKADEEAGEKAASSFEEQEREDQLKALREEQQTQPQNFAIVDHTALYYQMHLQREHISSRDYKFVCQRYGKIDAMNEYGLMNLILDLWSVRSEIDYNKANPDKPKGFYHALLRTFDVQPGDVFVMPAPSALTKLPGIN